MTMLQRVMAGVFSLWLMQAGFLSEALVSTALAQVSPPAAAPEPQGAGGAGVASATIDARHVETVLKALQNFGYVAKAGKDDDGDPNIEVTVSKSRFRISFYDCTDGRDCKSLLFSAGWDVQKPLALEKINDWNRSKRFGKAYLDEEGDPHLDFDLNLDYGGVALKNFEDTLDWWRISLTEFEKIIN